MTPAYWVQQLRTRVLDVAVFADYLRELRVCGVRDGVWVNFDIKDEVLLYGRALSQPGRLPSTHILPVYTQALAQGIPVEAKKVLQSLQKYDPRERMPAWMLYSGSATRQEVYAYLWLWVCYTLADHCIDGEEDASVLPAVLWAQREMWRCLEGSPKPACDYFAAHLHEFESALGTSDPNAPWKRSSAVAALISVAGWDQGDPGKSYESILPVLTARQLLDDLHDWRADLAQGIQTLPVHLHGAGVPDPLHYWSTVVPEVCERIEEACEQMPPFFAYEAAMYRDAVWRTRTTRQLAALLQAS